MKSDDYISDGHHFWIHFVCGFVVGAGLGLWVSWNVFDTRWGIIIGTAAIALIIAFCCGRWGDSAWEWIAEHHWWFY